MSRMTKFENNFPSYNDGIAKFYRLENKRNEFGATTNETSDNNPEIFLTAHYSECSKREQDYEFAESQGSRLSLKIKIPYTKTVDVKCKARIGDMIYSVFQVDVGRTIGFVQELYIYLEEERRANA